MYRKILFMLLLCCFACLSLDAQKPLRKPLKPTQSSNAGNDGKSNSASRPSKPASGTSSSATPSKQPVKSGSSAPRIVATGSIAGHDYVDLGLSVKWATCNVGATSPSGYGNYYAWGETSPKSEYTEGNSVTYKKNMGDIAGDSRYDAARANWGGSWRLPTDTEMGELISKCKTQWITYDGHKGYLITGPNGKSIFLPAAGWRIGPISNYVGKIGSYWSSLPNRDGYVAVHMLFTGSKINNEFHSRDYGRSVRPVSE